MFTIIIKNDRHSSYNKLGFFILLIHLLYFTGYFLKVNSNTNMIAIGGGIGIALIGLALNIITTSKHKKPMIPFAVIYLLLALVWGGLINYWLSMVLIILAFLDHTVRKKPALIFTESNIEVKVFPKKKYEWQEMNNVILKDNILTLDFKNDRLMQAEIDAESYGVDEGSFNRFCEQYLVLDTRS